MPCGSARISGRRCRQAYATASSTRVELAGNHYLAGEEWGGVAVMLAEELCDEPPEWGGSTVC